MQVKMYCDGGSRGNPGVAGSGAVVYDASGETLGEIAYVVGKKSSNNVAEYHGLIQGLEASRSVGATRVDVFMDSKLVVEQMTGRWKIKHPDMQKLARQARDIASGFEKVTYTWVPRAKNKKADELSNVAMDAAARGDKPGIVKGTGVWAGASAPAASGASASGASASDASASVGPAVDKRDAAAHWAGHESPRTRFILLRHGQTHHSAERRFSGTSNPDLTDTGREQAKRAASALQGFGRIDTIVASPQARAQQTAEYAAEALGLSIATDDGLRELDFGDFEGLTRDEVIAKDAEAFATWQSSPNNAPPSGESLTAFHRRVTRARLKLQERYEGQTVLLVTHMTPVKSIVRQALGANADLFKHVFLDLASISVVDFYGDYGVVRCVNDVAHHR
ncbi:bifunctional RNase H/acid phosphatase [Corynebacterium lujinxingii]|uniref:Bifunctional RNase H/acid phosphatase n=1 Tax=Corynebacterium lujinxingii TaxID=2763010 RepID=A0A7H0JXC6_9CORY|nr:bifunctional RNase H/acid phosphatase [Corynebacterium lujinxingii]MBC3177877.1 bifunctional RNase H/acid phosphatase [Corynebacterium lujinxingii]NNO09878.1 bifunctional RNase H/acid phosphatase [Corynebacterium lujinxingii]QNP89692.1 bifunctional RNase H/acid phosphatase [Corynebacterium lujinxingii]